MKTATILLLFLVVLLGLTESAPQNIRHHQRYYNRGQRVRVRPRVELAQRAGSYGEVYKGDEEEASRGDERNSRRRGGEVRRPLRGDQYDSTELSEPGIRTERTRLPKIIDKYALDR
jgi:hypothetical protein